VRRSPGCGLYSYEDGEVMEEGARPTWKKWGDGLGVARKKMGGLL